MEFARDERPGDSAIGRVLVARMFEWCEEYSGHPLRDERLHHLLGRLGAVLD